jgi:hypothetical protein
VSLRKKVLLGIASAVAVIAVLWLPIALGLMAGFPFSLWDDPGDPVAPVGARATLEESVDCLAGYELWIGSTSQPKRLDDDKVADCFPTQTAAQKQALITCFNAHEQDHPDHEGWPEENMRGCTWDGMTTVPVRNVASLTFDKVVAVPAEPREGRRFVLTAPVTRSDSNAKVEQRGEIDVENPVLDVAVTVNGENVALESVEGCSQCLPPGDPKSLYSFSDGRIRVELMVPEASEGKRMAIKMRAGLDQGGSRTFGPTRESGPLALPDETPTATKVVTYTVAP